MLACAESNFSNFKFEYIRENEFFEKNYFSLFIRGPDGFDSWNKIEVENLVTLPL